MLIDEFKDAVRGERKRELRGFTLNTRPGSGGSYDPEARTLNLSPDTLTGSGFNQHNMSFVLGHEMEHGFNRAAMSRVRDQFDAEARWVASDARPVHDYTEAGEKWMGAHRTNEAEAHIAGWNAMLGYEKQRSGNPNAGLTEMWNNADNSRVADVLQLDASGAPVARAGLSFNADASLSDRTTATPPVDNVKAIGQHYFDQPPAGTPGVAAQDTTTLGPYNHSDYRNDYGAGMVGRMIWFEQNVAVPRHGAASRMHLDLQRLGLSETLMEENGISITGRSTSQAYRDTSTRPSVAGRLDHTADGPNKERHVPIDAPVAGARGSAGVTDEGAQRADAVPARTQGSLLSDPEHPGHSMFNGTLQALGQRDAFPNARIDHVVFNTDRNMLIGVQGSLNDPTQYLAGVNVQRTIATPIEQSSEASRTALQSAQQGQEVARTQAEALDAQARPMRQ